MSYTITNYGDKSFYNRCFHSMETNVINSLANCYNVESKQIILTSSGIEALSILLQTIMISNNFKKINIFYSNELYCDSPRIIKYFSEIYGCFE